MKKLGMSGMDKMVVFDQRQNADNFLPLPDANKVATNGENKVLTCVVIFGKSFVISIT